MIARDLELDAERERVNQAELTIETQNATIRTLRDANAQLGICSFFFLRWCLVGLATKATEGVLNAMTD